MRLEPAIGLVRPAKKQSGQWLTELRLARALTQVQLAAAVGVSQRAISPLKTVADYQPVPLLVALCDVLQSSADELLGRRPPPKVAALRQPPEENRLWRHLKASLRERDQRVVLRFIDTAARVGGGG